MKHTTIRTTLLLTLATFAVLAAINGRFYFATPFHEQGDIAVNALQIDRAGRGVEILGNYSRFHFNHPGPAFFYVYALGERVLLDWLHAVPSPHNAHSLAGLLLQCFFFSLALAIFYDHLRAPLFIPIALVLASIHFGLGRNAFISVWPPHVLTMPFLCFFAACASVAAGRGRHLPAAMLAGCFLAHGHVAQPLFVVTLFLAAYGTLWFGLRRTAAKGGPGGEGAARPSTPWRAFPRTHALSAAVLAVFLLPLVIDWLRWPDDNLALILRHLRDNAHDHKKIVKSVLYFLTYFSYIQNQEDLLHELSPASGRFLLENAWWYVGWALVAAFVAWRCRGRFVRSVAVFWALAALLCVEWGVMQSGPMTEFNGHFTFALLFAPLLLLAAAAASWLGSRPRRLAAAVLCAAAAAISARSFAFPAISREESGLDLLAATRAILRADPAKGAAKVLVFDAGDWPDVASAALALDRAGVPFEVDPSWGFMFGRQRDLPPQAPRATLGGMAVWRFLRRAPAGTGFPFHGDLRVSLEPATLDPAGGVIDCSIKGNLDQYQVSGFTTPDQGFVYTDQPEAVLQAGGPPARRDVLMDIRAWAYIAPPGVTSQPMDLWVNGVRVGRAVIDSDVERDVVLRIPASAWNLRRPSLLVMSFPSARSPTQLGINGDPRILGWGVRAISVRYAE